MNTLLTVLLMCAIIGHTLADRKRCFCKVVASDNKSNVIHDFGTITTHRHWLSVGCHGCEVSSNSRNNSNSSKMDLTAVVLSYCQQ
ncbi:hypothetical protein ACF0H5_002041 [Mactra antiquata]